MNRITPKLLMTCALALVVLASPVVHAAEYFLRADVTTITLPDATEVVMWGFAQDSAADVEDGQVTIPGPLLTVPPGDTELTIHLKNNLTAAATGLGMGCPASVVIPGQRAVMTPTRFGAAPYPQYEGRIRNLTYDTPPGGTADYTWSNLRPGSVLYHSGNHLACHVQMGLYGGVVVYPAAPQEAYPGIAYDREVVLFYSEIDPVFHETVANADYGPGKSMTSTIDYEPRYFLVNGQPYSPAQTPLDAGAPGETVLVRMFNAGLETHVPVFQNLRATVVAEDAFPYTYPKDQYSIILPAGKTKDVLIENPAAGSYPVYDRRLRLTDYKASQGGLLAFLQVQEGPVNAAPVINSVAADPIAIYDDQTSQLSVDATDPDAGPATLTYYWIVPVAQGSVDDPTSPNPVFTPAPVDGAVQVVDLTVQVSDGYDTVWDNVQVSVQKAGTINFNDYDVVPHATGHDSPAAVASIEDGGVTLHLTGNAWKRIEGAWNINMTTVLEFDYQSTVMGELQGIGFGYDNYLRSNRMFQLLGPQIWGIQDYHDYDMADGWKHYRIPVGRFFMGEFPYMVFMNDDDYIPTGQGFYRNVMLHDEPVTTETGLLVNGVLYPVESFGGITNDRESTVTIEDGGATLRIQGNAWKKVGFQYQVLPDTVLEFDFQSGTQGEIHAIGLGIDDLLISRFAFMLYGTQNWGNLDYKDYAGETPKHYVIPIGQFHTGSRTNLFFVNDDDSVPTGEGVFSNIQIYEAAPPPIQMLSITPVPCPADLNGDGTADAADIRILADQWGQKNCTDCAADLNGDGNVDVDDLVLFRESYFKGCP